MIYAIAILLNSTTPQTKLVALMGMVEYIQCDRLVMVVIRGLDIEQLKSSGEETLIRAVVEHDRLICQLFTTNTLLPLRFGTAFKSQDLLEAYLRSNYAELITKLEQLQGCSEYLLTLTLLESDSVKTNSKPEQPQLKGKDYLLAKRSHYLAEQAKRSQQQQECQDLMALVPTSQQVISPQAEEFLRAYFLATSDRMSELGAAISKWQSEFPHWQLELSNPLPPYHFCD
jgi:hypothetical protein